MGADLVAVEWFSVLVAAVTKTTKHDARVAETHAGLASVSHKTYEPALSTLGELLGAEAWKPDGDARADSVWCWADERWITLEAKSEPHAGITEEKRVPAMVAVIDTSLISSRISLSMTRKVSVGALTASTA